MNRVALNFALVLAFAPQGFALAADLPDAQTVLRGLREFYQETARADGSFQPGVDPEYLGMSDCAHSDLAAVTYACTISKTFGWQLPHEQQTIEFLLSRQKASGEFVNVAGTVDPQSPQGKTYNTTQALVALKSLGAKPRHDPLPVFEAILKQDYKTLPAYSTSFFPLAYLCAGRPIPEQADRAIRALMVQDEDGYLNDHVAATFHAAHYYGLVGEPTPKARPMVARMLRDQKPDGSWFLNLPARDRHATFDAVFTLRHLGTDRADCQAAIQRAGRWALACRNADGGFGHFPGSTSDADAVYFQVGTLVMAGFLKPADPLPADPHLLSWGHLMPVAKSALPVSLTLPGWVGGVAFSPDAARLATASSDGAARLWDSHSGQRLNTFEGHKDCAAAVAFAPGGKTLATGSYDHTAILWDVVSGKPLSTLEGHRGAVLSVAFSPDGGRLATASVDQTIRLWDAKSGKPLRTLSGHKSWVNSLAFTPDGKLISGSSDGTVKIWSGEGELQTTLQVSRAEVRSVAVSPDGKSLAAGIRYGAVKLWRAEPWEELHSLQIPADDVGAVVFSPDSRQLLVAAGEWNRPTEIKQFDIQSGKQTRELKHPGEALSLAVAQDGQIAVGGGDKTVSLFLAPMAATR